MGNGAKDLCALFYHIGLTINGDVVKVARWWGKNPNDDPHLMKLNWRGNALKFVGFKMYF